MLTFRKSCTVLFYSNFPKSWSETKIRSKIIGLDKGGYLVNIFLISPRKHMLWVLIRSASVRLVAMSRWPD